MVEIRIEDSKIDKKKKRKTSVLVIGIFENEHDFTQLNEIDPFLSTTVEEIINNKEFKGLLGSNIILYTVGNGPIKKLMLIGLGRREKFTNETARIIAGKAALKAKEMGLADLSLIPFSNKLDEDLIEAIAEGILLSLYSFNRYKTNNEENGSPKPNEITILANSESSKYQPLIDKVNLIAQAVYFARDLGNLPPNECSPANLANFATSLGNEYQMKTRIIERYEMESIRLAGVVAVGKGSNNPPKVIILEYSGAPDEQKPYLLIGKAVTFDTGGISLKPGDKMDEMKFDKCGGCTVLGILKAISSLKLSLNIVAIIPCVENMPSAASYRPGDIIQMYNGKTVEVLNTDAEGRIILADAIAYGINSYHPKAIIDLATLTGACIIALGSNVAAAIGTSKELIYRLTRISQETGEKIWELPLYDEFHDQLRSTVADIKNIGGRPGGAITAAAFLSNFTCDVPWVHLDIAGTAWTQEGTYERSYNPKGATGFGLRTIVKLLTEDGNNTRL
ncbi:MAG: leucyl aminopeptidase [Nitrososphaeraceae archaeon]